MLRPPRHPQPPHRSRRIGLPGLAETAPTGSRSAKTRRPPCRKPFRQNRPQSGTRPVRFRPPPLNGPEDFRRYGCSAVCEYPSRKCSEKIRPSPLPPPQTCPRSRYRILRHAAAHGKRHPPPLRDPNAANGPESVAGGKVRGLRTMLPNDNFYEINILRQSFFQFRHGISRGARRTPSATASSCGRNDETWFN